MRKLFLIAAVSILTACGGGGSSGGGTPPVSGPGAIVPVVDSTTTTTVGMTTTTTLPPVIVTPPDTTTTTTIDTTTTTTLPVVVLPPPDVVPPVVTTTTVPPTTTTTTTVATTTTTTLPPVVTPPVVTGPVVNTLPMVPGVNPGTNLYTVVASVNSSLTAGLPARTVISDPGFEQALVDLGLDDAVDGSILTSKITNVNNLTITKNYGIVSISGIENFVSLKYLNVDHNLLASVDLSKNISLLQVVFWGGKLTSLDVTKLVNLDVLGISDTLITSIDLSKNTVIRELDFQNSLVPVNGGLASLNIANNIYLERVYLMYNSITTVDTSHSPKMTDFWGNNDKFTSLDFSNNPVMDMVIVYNNTLSYLNVANGRTPRNVATDGNPNLLQVHVINVTNVLSYIAGVASDGIHITWIHDIWTKYVL